MKTFFKSLTTFIFCFCGLFIFAQETSNNTSIEVHEMNGFRFELHHQSSKCPACEICVCKEVLVYNPKSQLIHNQLFKGNTELPKRIYEKMDVYDFNFDGFPDFRMVDFDVYYDVYYIYQPTSENYLVNPYLSQCTNLNFYDDNKEAIGFYFGSFELESKNFKTGSYLNSHRFHFKGENLEQLTVESKVWYNPWNGPEFYQDTISPKYLYTRTCSYKNFILEQIGDEVITIGEFSPLPISKDSINLRTKVHHYQSLQPKIQYEDPELPNNYILYKDRAKDTVMNKKHYSWVVYDLNHIPFEIGEDYTNGIKNGEWIRRDQQGRIVSIEKYLNDTLCGMANYYYYHNFPWNVTRISGVVLNGYKVGEWNYFENGKFKSINDKKWTKARTDNFDRNGKLISISIHAKEEELAYTMFYDSDGKISWWVFYDKNGNIVREENKFYELTKNLDEKMTN